ncbi:MAG: RNA methyltransferase [Planctomycetota bacterium]
MSSINVEMDDARLEVFRNLNERSTGRGEDPDSFVVEGALIVRRLLESDYRVRTIVVDAGRDLETLGTIPAGVDVVTLARDSIEKLAGFSFHRGFLASADRPPLQTSDEVSWEGSGLSLALVGVSDMENVGSMLRSAAAFGVRRVLIDDRTVDPLSRRSIRVSMGAALGMEFVRFKRIAEDISKLARRDVVTLAATPAEDSLPIDAVDWGDRPVLLLVGNEARGLSKRVQNAATHRVHIPMDRRAMETLVDSLNVSVATAILLHELRRAAARR